MKSIFSLLGAALALSMSAPSQATEPFSAMDVFKIAYAANSVVSPNGKFVAFDRFYMDVMSDTRRSDVWVIGADGNNLQQISEGFDAAGPATFTASGQAIAFAAIQSEASHIYLQNLDTGERSELGQGLSEPANLSFLTRWSMAGLYDAGNLSARDNG